MKFEDRIQWWCQSDEASFRQRGAEVYKRYEIELKRRFKWLRPSLFTKSLETDLGNDARSLIAVLKKCGRWDASKDSKLRSLEVLLKKKYPNQKVLISVFPRIHQP